MFRFSTTCRVRVSRVEESVEDHIDIFWGSNPEKDDSVIFYQRNATTQRKWDSYHGTIAIESSL